MPKQISFKSIIFVNRIVQRLENSTDNLFRDTKVFNGGLRLRVFRFSEQQITKETDASNPI